MPGTVGYRHSRKPGWSGLIGNLVETRWSRSWSPRKTMGNRITNPSIAPRLIRLRDAPFYLGMDRNRFNEWVRPTLTEIPIGSQGIAFDRLELDAWVEDYISCNGRPGQSKGDQPWDAKKHRAFSTGPAFGTSTNKSREGEFAKALEQVASKKRNNT
jgi:predicted DNA-binding transcriptional regulator AlpA